MNRSLVSLLGALCLAAAACGTPEPGETVVRIDGTVSSLVTTVPESTTTTSAGTQTTTTLVGSDPGACPAPGEVVIVALIEDVADQAPCSVSTDGMIRFSNLTDTPVTVEWGGRQITVAAQRSAVPPETVGEVLSPGLHVFVTSIESTPTVRVAAPQSGFGAAQVGLRSFGGIRPGQRLSAAESAIGSAIVIADRNSPCSIGWVQGDPHSPILGLDTSEEDPLIMRVDATSAGQKTLSGVAIGSSLTDLQNAYGEQLIQLSEFQYGFEPNEAADANFRLVFDITDTGPTVTNMRIGRLGELDSSAPCA